MPNIASVLKEEIRRLARKEARALTAPLKKALAAERKSVAALRKQVASLARSNGRAVRSAGAVAPVQADATQAPTTWRKDTVRSTRKQLGLTQAQLAKLLGVSQISVSFWETGRSTPRARAQAKVMEARKLSKAEAHARLGSDGGKRKPGPKPGAKRAKKARRAKATTRKAGRRGRSKKA